MWVRMYFLALVALLGMSQCLWAGSLVHDWSTRFGGTSADGGRSVATDESGNVILAGYFWATVDLGGDTLTSAGGDDIFLAKFDSAGTHLWSKRFGDSSGDLVRDVTVDGSGNLIMTGRFLGTVDFGGGSLTSAGNADIYLAKFDPSGTHIWSKSFGDANADFGGWVAVDQLGNVFVTGFFPGSVDFGGGVLTSAGFEDVFVAKFDSSGAHLWSKRFGGAGHDGGLDVAVDRHGNVMVVGTFDDTIDFGDNLLTSAGSTDIFVAKFDSSGAHLWSKRFGDANPDYCRSVVADDSSNVIIAGEFQISVDFGGGPLTNTGLLQIYLAKFDSAGTHVWSQNFSGSGDCYDMAVVWPDNVLLTGDFWNNVDFGGGVLTSAGGFDAYVAQFDAAGTHILSQRFGSTLNDRGFGIAVDGSRNVIATGLFRGTIDLGGGALASAGGDDIYLGKWLWRQGAVSVPEPGVTPPTFRLAQNRPNPYRSRTTISFEIPKAALVRLFVFDVRGSLVKVLLDQSLGAGQYALPWTGDDENGRRVRPGLYLYRMEVNGLSYTRKAIVIR